MSGRVISLIREDRADRPALDTAISRAILLEVEESIRGETLRVYRPARLVAFGRQDVISPGYPTAVEAARQQGYEAIERLAGGRAAVFHHDTVAFAWAVPESDPKTTITPRFLEIADIVTEALSALGVSARVGAVPGEYCPGDYSVNVDGRRKLMGVGQRLTRGAAHVGGVIVVDDAASIRDVLVPVYDALALPWEPSTVGAVQEEAPDVTFDVVANALVRVFDSRFTLVEESIGPETEARAALLEDDHLSP